ncbi:MAG TPA: WhiB family transcriptional regulator [Jiangellaceae bacterium]
MNMMPDREPWMLDAICAQTDPDAFYPEQGVNVIEAVRVCRSCPVRVECLQYALDNNERWGIWGGVTERTRRRMRSAAKVVAA